MSQTAPENLVFLLSSPTSWFEHRIFTTLTLLMRNLTEQIQDYGSQYYYNNHHHNHIQAFFNSSVVVLDEEDSSDILISTQQQQQHLLLLLLPQITRVLVTVLSVIGATYFLNKRVLKSKTIQYVVELLISHLIILPILPFVGTFFATIGVVRLLIYAWNQLFYRGKRFLVAPEDGFWAYEQHASSSCSNCVYVIKGTCDLGRIKKKLESVVVSPVVNARLFRRLISFCGFPVWENVDHLDINQHVRVAKRKHSNNNCFSDHDVLDYLTRLQDTPLRSDRPGWEVVVFPNVVMSGSGNDDHGDQYYACVFRIHHALMDGISSANILHQALGDHPFKFTIDPVTDNAHKRPGVLMNVMLYLIALVLLPRTGLVNGLLGLDNMHNKYFHPGKILKGPKHFTWSRPLKMEGIKKIKDESKTSVMTVLLSGLGASYRSVLLQRKNRKTTKKSRSIPEFYHALAPVAMLPYKDRHPRNGFSGCSLPVAVGKFSNPLDRLRSNHVEFKKLNLGMFEILGNFMLIGMVGVMPNFLQWWFQRAVHFKMSLSNIPGSDEQIRIFGGDTIVEMGAWLPCKFTLGMAMGLFSYGGRCRATFVGDSTYLSKSDVESLVTNFETEIRELGRSLGLSDRDIFY